MKRLLITGAGGAPSTNFIRSLRQSDEPFYFIGVDCDPYYLQRAQTDERYLVPLANDPDYVPILDDLIARTEPDLIYSQPDQEILVISKERERLWSEFGVRTFLPEHRTILLLQDKYESNKCWKNAGIKVPESLLIESEEDVEEAFKRFGTPIWLRANYSPGGGRGAFRAETMKEARGWLEFCGGWDGTFSAAECLTPHSITWMALYNQGELVVAQSRKRMYWEFANRAPSGVTGITGAGVTVSDPVMDEIAEATVKAVDASPHGIFSVDLTYDRMGVPNPTEINIGRFFTTHQFFTAAGLNLPHLFVKLAFNEQLPTITKKINPLPENLVWIRGMDIQPVLTEMEQVERDKADLLARRGRVSGAG